VGCVQTLRKKYCCEPLCSPEPVQVATCAGTVALSVPATKPRPLPVHVTFDAGITSRPDRRSLLARTVRTTACPCVARALALIVTGPPAAGTLLRTAGSASGTTRHAGELCEV